MTTRRLNTNGVVGGVFKRPAVPTAPGNGINTLSGGLRAGCAQRRTSIGVAAFAALVSLVLLLPPAAPAGERGAVGDLYLLASGTNNVLRFDGETGDFLGEFIPSNNGWLDYPTDMKFGPDGNLYISCLYGDNVVQFDGATGAPIRVFVEDGIGPERPGPNGPRGLLFMPDDRLLVLTGAKEVREFAAASTIGVFSRVLAAQIRDDSNDNFYQAIVHPNGNLLLSNPRLDYQGQVFEYHATTGHLVREFVPTGVFEHLIEMAWGPDGSLYASDYKHGVFELDAETGAVVRMLVNSPGIGSFVFRPNGNLLGRYMQTGQIYEFDGQTGEPLGLFAEIPAGTPFLYLSHLIVKPPPPEPALSPTVRNLSISTASACDNLVGVTVTGSNLDADRTAVMLSRYDEPAAYMGVVTGGSGDGTSLTVNFDLDGGARIATGWWDITVKNPDGQLHTRPHAVWLRACRNATAGNVFILAAREGHMDVSQCGYGIYEFDDTTTDPIRILTQDISGEDLSNSLANLVFTPSGDVLVAAGAPFADPEADSVIRFDGTTGRKIGVFIPPGTAGMLTPAAMAIGPDQKLYIGHANFGPGGGPGGVLVFDAQTGQFVRELVPLGSCGLYRPAAMRLGSSGDLYVATMARHGTFRFDGLTGGCVGPQPFIPAPTEDPGADYRALAFSPASHHLYLPWRTPDPALGRVDEYNAETGEWVGTPVPPGLQPALEDSACAVFRSNGHLLVETSPYSTASVVLECDVSGGTVSEIFAGRLDLWWDMEVRPRVADLTRVLPTDLAPACGASTPSHIR